MDDRGGIPAEHRAVAALDTPSRQRAAFFNVAFSYGIVVVVLLQGFVLTPMYLARIPVALYGAWLATGNVLAWIELVDPGLATLLQQRVAFSFGRRDARDVATVIGSGLIVVTLFSALPLAAMPFAGGIAQLVNLSGDLSRELVVAFRLGLVSVTLALAADSVGAVNAGLQRTGVSGAIGLAGSVVGILVTLLLLLGGARLNAIPAGLVARGVFVLLANGVALRYWSARHLPEGLVVSRKEAVALLHLSTFAFVGRLGATLLQKLDGFLSAHLVSPTAAAVFTLTGRPFEIVRMACDRISGGLVAPIAHLAGEGGSARLREVVTHMMAVAAWISCIGLGLVIAFNGLFVQLWVGRHLYGGDALSIAIAASTATTVQVVLFAHLVYGLGGVRSCSLIVLGEALVRIPMQLFLGRRFGLIGLPLAAVATSLTITLVLLPLAAERLIGTRRGELLRPLWRRMAFVAMVATLGIPLRYAIARAPVNWTWTGFAVAVSLSGVAFACILVGTDRSLRGVLRSAHASLGRRLGES
jgi:O-antigen/teichoic acid export membrane protein